MSHCHYFKWVIEWRYPLFLVVELVAIVIPIVETKRRNRRFVLGNNNQDLPNGEVLPNLSPCREPNAISASYHPMFPLSKRQPWDVDLPRPIVPCINKVNTCNYY